MQTVEQQKTGLPALTLAALGVVYGDIGTSPLYTMKEVFFGSHHPVPVTPENVFGILSLILWSLIMVVSVKYVAFVMRADNRGEGGIMALIALASQHAAHNHRKQKAIALIGIVGACMFYADGMITPAISVLSAVEGIEVAAPAMSHAVVPVTLIILFVLFSLQRRGTGVMGKLFGPIMLLWFGTLGTLGIINILHKPDILLAANPFYAFQFFSANSTLAFIALGAVVLAVTGAEALYADMGHFGRKSIRIAWFGLVLPSLLLNYFGQGAEILQNPEAVKNPFFLLAPDWLMIPLVFLSTAAAVIASQAVISGAFSVSRQALLLGYLPRMLVLHTSESEEGQIYLPRVNWTLMVMVMALVIGFGSSNNLAAAYGIAVTGDMVITTLLSAIVFHGLWGWGWPRTLALAALFLAVDLAFFGANVLKIPDGGWFPLLIGVVIFTLMTTWHRGRDLLFKRVYSEAIALDPFIMSIGAYPPTLVPGTAVFLTPSQEVVPQALMHNLKHNKVLHQRIILTTVKIHDIPHVPETERIIVKHLPYVFHSVILNYGFKDDPDLPRDLVLCARYGLEIDVKDVSFFIGRDTLIPRLGAEMAYWREKLFVTMFRNADPISNYFKLPPNRVVELGAQVTL